MSDEARDRQLQKLLSAVAALTDEVSELKREVAALKDKVNETRDIVEAWQAVKTGGRFVKWVAGVGSGVAGAWLVLKAFGAALLK